MYTTTHRSIGTALLVLGLVLSTSFAAPAQAAAGVAQPTRSAEDALLSEVRLIRETLQRAQTNAQRERLVMERMRMHDERVERLGRQIAEVRDEIGGIEIHIAQMNEREASLELQIQKANDPNQRRALESELKEGRFAQDAQTQRLHRLRDRESVLAAQLRKEERTLRGLEARLDALDREIEADARKRNGPSQVSGR